MVADFIAFLSNSLTITLLVAYIFALWAALVVWTWLDISARTDSILYRLGALLIVATGAVLGFAIYLLLRPTFTKEEGRVREVEEAILASQTQLQACPNCFASIRKDFAFCPNCSGKLTGACESCQRSVSLAWNICPFCGTKQKKLEEETDLVKKPGLLARSFVIVTGVRAIFANLYVKNKPKKNTVIRSEAKRKSSSRKTKKKKS
jgi:RNA polymerase subunit RPABC4/transcription elongation factor Spt4